jgi:CheY-like chemotaxis protein
MFDSLINVGVAMEEYKSDQSLAFHILHQRSIKPCVYVIDRKPHIRRFLTDVLEEFGHIIRESADSSEIVTTATMQLADLVVVGPSATPKEGAYILRTLAANKFNGEVLLLGPNAAGLDALQEFGEKIGLEMLPALPTPFNSANLRDRILMAYLTAAAPPRYRAVPVGPVSPPLWPLQ